MSTGETPQSPPAKTRRKEIPYPADLVAVEKHENTRSLSTLADISMINLRGHNSSTFSRQKTQRCLKKKGDAVSFNPNSPSYLTSNFYDKDFVFVTRLKYRMSCACKIK